MVVHESWQSGNKGRYIHPLTSPLSFWNWGRYNGDNSGDTNDDDDGWIPEDVEEGISAVKWVAVALIIGILLIYFGAIPRAILGKVAKKI